MYEGASIQGVTVDVSITGLNISNTVIAAAVGNWTGTCGSSSLPSMQIDGDASVEVTVYFHSEMSPNGRCGSISVVDYPASNPAFDAQVGDGTIIHLYESGANGPCDPEETLTHEFGHMLGLGDAPSSCSADHHIMSGATPGTPRTVQQSDCDTAQVENADPPDDPPDNPCTGGAVSGSGGGDAHSRAERGLDFRDDDLRRYGGRWPAKVAVNPCTTGDGLVITNIWSPIVVDVDRPGFRFSGIEDGVWFDINADGELEWLAWTEEVNGDAFLVLDRNSNGLIDDGSELFGNYTAQPPSDDPNGYEALAVFDQPMNGGNGDGLISAADDVFSELRLWVDSNHDAVSQSHEIFLPWDFDITIFDLDYRFSHRQDRHGNLSTYRSWAYRSLGPPLRTTDVFFLGLIPPE